jgi:hypothetical protein
MSLLKQVVKTYRQDELIKESAAAGATAAHGVAGFRGHFFGDKKKKKKMLRRKLPGSYHYIGENIEDEKFDSADVISKLKKAERRATHEEDTKGFALEDDQGQIVKVYVSAEQAEDFEHALGAALNGTEDTESDIEGASTPLEIAEVLFNLKDRFTIVDVDWPSIEEDEEQEVEAEAPGGFGGEGEAPEGDPEGELDTELSGEGDEADMEAELQADDELGGEMGGGPDMEGALTSIIDLLKSQADAQKAEAQAREAEANAEEAKYNAAAADSKVKQEEQVLDMEAYYDEQGKKEKEAKQLAKLAKWKHETAQEAANKMKGDAGEFTMPEKEEDNEEVGVWHQKLPGEERPNKFTYGPDENRDKKLQPGEFIKYLLKSVQGN